ncbi:hypothetical protein H7F51_13600 [Novosphingobium flavum]|uniref:Uncharacterized protein n=1 Tax=Novosphingobium flavum TaxID=1778672 RepID=A0A7X1FT91_9SPHN|nr:hypothetical protein [Novosphingobium flavum]MBC2666556.1 hypothetical protein [Novosphingobium flavum]
MLMLDSSGGANALAIRIGGPFADVLRRVKHRACYPYGCKRPDRPAVDGGAIYASPSRMSGERTQQALARIEAALARIEQAGSAAEAASVEAARRHEVLRSAVSETLRDLDILIGEQGR